MSIALVPPPPRPPFCEPLPTELGPLTARYEAQLSDLSAAEPAKRLATLRALAALQGITLHELEGDYGRMIYIATQGHWTRQLDSLEDVKRWLLENLQGGRTL